MSANLRWCFGEECRDLQPPEAFRTPRCRVCIVCTTKRKRRTARQLYRRRARRRDFREVQAARKRKHYHSSPELREWNRKRSQAYRAFNRDEINRLRRAGTRQCSGPSKQNVEGKCRRLTREASGRCAYHRLPARRMAA